MFWAFELFTFFKDTVMWLIIIYFIMFIIEVFLLENQKIFFLFFEFLSFWAF